MEEDIFRVISFLYDLGIVRDVCYAWSCTEEHKCLKFGKHFCLRSRILCDPVFWAQCIKTRW